MDSLSTCLWANLSTFKYKLQQGGNYALFTAPTPVSILVLKLKKHFNERVDG